MKFIELFAGIGGFRLGLEKTGHECVYVNEWLQKPASIYEKNFGEKPDTSDIRTIDPFSIPDADLICGGFPCATFSIAGKRTGFSIEDTRGTLFFEICRIASAKRTPYILFENVSGLLGHDDGKTFAVIIESFHELGYDCQWQLCNSKYFGVPQERERIFVVANLRGHPRPKVFPIKGFVTEDDGSGCEKTVKAFLTPKRKEKRQQGRRIKEHNEPSFTLTAQDRHGVLIGNDELRLLTPLESERLQGLPDNFTKYYADGKIVPDNERWERCGRTVTIPIIEEIGKRLYEFY